MSPQIACLRGCKITLAAFVWLFSTVSFQVCPSRTRIKAGIFTLVTFVWLFSAVYFQMYPQMACIRSCIVTLIAFIWLDDIVICRIFSIAAVCCAFPKRVPSNWVKCMIYFGSKITSVGILSLFHCPRVAWSCKGSWKWLRAVDQTCKYCQNC